MRVIKFQNKLDKFCKECLDFDLLINFNKFKLFHLSYNTKSKVYHKTKVATW